VKLEACFFLLLWFGKACSRLSASYYSGNFDPPSPRLLELITRQSGIMDDCLIGCLATCPRTIAIVRARENFLFPARQFCLKARIKANKRHTSVAARSWYRFHFPHRAVGHLFLQL